MTESQEVEAAHVGWEVTYERVWMKRIFSMRNNSVQLNQPDP